VGKGQQQVSCRVSVAPQQHAQDVTSSTVTHLCGEVSVAKSIIIQLWSVINLAAVRLLLCFLHRCYAAAACNPACRTTGTGTQQTERPMHATTSTKTDAHTRLVDVIMSWQLLAVMPAMHCRCHIAMLQHVSPAPDTTHVNADGHAFQRH